MVSVVARGEARYLCQYRINKRPVSKSLLSLDVASYTASGKYPRVAPTLLSEMMSRSRLVPIKAPIPPSLVGKQSARFQHAKPAGTTTQASGQAAGEHKWGSCMWHLEMAVVQARLAAGRATAGLPPAEMMPSRLLGVTMPEAWRGSFGP